MRTLLHRLLAGALAASLTYGCSASTRYQPKDTSRARLVIVDGELGIQKASATTPVGPMALLVECDPAARRFAEASQDLRREAEDYVLAAGVLDAFLGPLLIGVVLRGIAANKASASRAALVDAINRHNDSETCRPTPDNTTLAQGGSKS